MPTRAILFAMLLAPKVAAQPSANVAEILSKVGDLYANATQYRFELKQSGEDVGSIVIAVQKPNRFHYETDGEVIGGNDRFGKTTMVGNGSVIWNYAAGLKQFTKKGVSLPLLDTEPPEVAADIFVLQAETTFISRYARLARAVDHAKLLREESNAYVVELAAPLPGFRDKYTWWIDKKRFVILREDTQPANPRFRSSKWEYSFVSINEPLADELFRFNPPPDAKQVDRLE